MYNRYRNKGNKGGPFGSSKILRHFLTAVWALADLQNSAVVMLMVVAIATVAYINPRSRNNGEKRLPVTPTPLYVELDWGDGLPHDLDLWIRCYNERDGLKTNMLTIGYKRRSEGWMDLLRDDFGKPSYINKEIAQSNHEVARVPAFTVCQFNAHLYHSHDGILPVEGRVLVIQDKDSEHEKAVADVKFQLKDPGQEITAVYATWDSGGGLIKDSVKEYPAAPQLMIATEPVHQIGGEGP